MSLCDWAGSGFARAISRSASTTRTAGSTCDKLLELATAGHWAAVREYPVTGNNSYSKMVARYRDDLVAVRKAQEVSATEQGAAR
jgi:hypothetical protein